MGTLFNQLPRKNFNYDLYEEIQELKQIAKDNKIKYSEVLETIKVLELRRKNNLYIDNGDILDEQLAGFGELIKNKICN